MPNEKIHSKRHTAHLEVVRRQDRAIRITAIVIAVVVIGLVTYGILSGTVFLAYRSVARVNGVNINVGDFQKQVKMQRLQLISRFNQYYQFAQMFGISDPMNDQNFGSALQQIASQLQTPEIVGQQMLDMMIDDVLISQEAQKRGITLAAADVDKGLQEGLGYFANGTPTPAATATEITPPELNPTQLALVTLTPTPTEIVPTATATLDPNITPTASATLEPTATAGPSATPEPSPTPYTLAGYQTAAEEQIKAITAQTDMSKDDYRKFFEKVLLRQKLEEAVTKDLAPAEEQVWARHILVSDPAVAKSIYEKLKAGDDFAKLATEFSMDTSNKDKGGDLGWFGKGGDLAWAGKYIMVAPFETAAYALKVGEISEPVQTDFGWHIIQVLGHESRPLTADDFTKYKQTFFADFLKKLREAATVTTDDALWKSIVPAVPALQQ